MRRDRTQDWGNDETPSPVPHDPYAELYHEVEPPLLVRTARVVVPWIALIAVVTIGLSLWSDFRFESRRATPTAESTATVEPTEAAGSEAAGSAEATTETESVAPEGTAPELTPGPVSTDEPYVRVKVNGLNMRAEASTDGAILKQLPSGTILEHMESTNGWYRVRDEAGSEGWVAAGGSFTELVTP